MRVRHLPLALILPILACAQTKLDATHSLEPFVVKGKRPAAADVEGPDGVRTYDESEIENSGAFTLQEFLETLPRGNGDEQVVLVDGVPMDLADLTPAMVATIEVSYSGSMPQYGAYSRGRIVNIRLKQDYNSRQVGLDVGGSLHGDAWRREVNLSGGILRGPWRILYSGSFSRADAVRADAREFSREQDHRTQGGRDFRLPWGDPAVVQAVTGNLAGVVDAAGHPVPVALVPENASGPLFPGQFSPGVGIAASGQRFFNTSPYLYLQSPSENMSARLRVMRVYRNLQLGLAAYHSLRTSRREGPPPVSAASAATVVPAAYNPFGQEVMVGLVHTGFGPVIQDSRGHSTLVSLTASWARPGEESWRLTGNLYQNRTTAETRTRDLDPDAFAVALATPGSAARFNPFLPGNSAGNAMLYPGLAIERTQANASRATFVRGTANGPIAPGWGAGPVRLSLNGNASWRRDERSFLHVRGVGDGVTRNAYSNYALNSFVSLPLLKDRPRFHRLEGQLSAAFSAGSRGGDTWRNGVRVSWAPVRTWSMHVEFGRTTSLPGEQGEDDPEATVETLMDPRRTPAVAENVQVISRRSATTESSESEDLRFSTRFDAPFRRGLTFNAGYQQRRANRATGSPFRPQDIIDNETLFAGRVVRDASTPADMLLGQPGRILVVDITAAAVAQNLQRSLTFGAELVWPAPVAGPLRGDNRGMLRAPATPRAVSRFTLNVDVDVPLTARYEVAAGQGFVSRESGPANQPDWTAQANLRWSKRRWSSGLNVRHAAASRLRTIPAITAVGADITYRFENSFWGKFGKDLRLRLRAQNVGGNRPPYADTILGYRGGSAIGTTLGFSLEAPW